MDGVTVIVDGGDGLVAKIGDEVSWGGGERDLRAAEDVTGTKIPERCHADAYLVTSAAEGD